MNVLFVKFVLVKKIFLSFFYRTIDSDKADSPEFETFMSNLENLYTKQKSVNPYVMFLLGTLIPIAKTG